MAKVSRMSTPRSTLFFAAIALISTSAAVYLALRPPAAPEEEEEYPHARPGETNPIAARVLAEGGPRTPTVNSMTGPRRGVARFAVSFDGSAAPCITAAAASAIAHLGAPDAVDPAIAAACAGAGPDRLEGMIVMATMPIAKPGAPKEPPVQATCTATLRATWTHAGATRPITASVGPATGALDAPCGPLEFQLQEAAAAALTP